MDEKKRLINLGNKATYLQPWELIQLGSLEAIDVKCYVQHFSGDNAYPIEYILQYKTLEFRGPRFDMTLINFIEKLLQFQEELKQLRQWKKDWMPIVQDWSDQH